MSEFDTTVVSRNSLISRVGELLQEQNSGFFGIIIVDIDDFHHINYQYGYRCGDEILAALGERLVGMLKHDNCVMRAGANEFILLLPGMNSPFLVEFAVKKVLKLVRQPFSYDSEFIQVTARAGVGVLPAQAGIEKALLLIAEQALVTARDSEESFAVLDKYDGDATKNYLLRDQLDQAIEVGDFEMYFQPKIDLKTDLPCGAEALIRWRGPDGRFVPPDLFIPIAEKSSRIDQITSWVVNNTIRRVNELPDKWRALEVAINLSGRCFARDSVVSEMEKYFGIWDAKPDQIIFEVTETVFMSDLHQTNDICNEFRHGLGVKVSIDDFGKGFSSLDYFRHIPADELKIDRSFVDGIARNQIDKNIVDCITKLAKGSGLTVVVEGIEDKETADVAKSLGCDKAQGYFYAKPMPFKEFVDWLENYKPPEE